MTAGSRFLLDTNVVIALFAGETEVRDRLKRAAEVFVPSIVSTVLAVRERSPGPQRPR